jgi:CubicO group peptidase (beta-lactamase class C family)
MKMEKSKLIAPKVTIINLVCISLFIVLGKGQGLASDSDNLFCATEKQIEQLILKGEIPSLSVAVARDGKIIWEKGFGLANKEKNIPATNHTKYKLASISKQLTATGLMILVERGLIDLDKPVNDYLGKVKLYARIGDAEEATVRRVVNHTSGMPLHSQHFYKTESYQPPPMDETISRYGILVTVPGERFQYSNLGYGLIGYVISRTSGKSYADFMHEEVFVPLGMDRTSVYLGQGLEDGQAVTYAPDDSVVPPYLSDSPGATAIVSSAHDLIRFGMFHLKNNLPDQRAIITEATIDKMQIPSPETGPLEEWECAGSGYGIGWVISTTKDNLRAVRHDGGAVGVSTTLTLIPKENIAVVILSNTKTKWRGAILIGILRSLLPNKLIDFPAPADKVAKKSQPTFEKELIGLWEGHAHTYEGEIPLVFNINASGSVYAKMGDQSRTILQDVSYNHDPNQIMMNTNGGFFLRGWIQGKLETEDVNRGKPYKLWLELKLRDNVLNGSLIAFSQRKFYTGPLTHWVEMKKK